MIASRLSNLSESLRSSSFEALALNASPSLVYLTGLHFHLSERPVVLLLTGEHEPVIILPELEMLKVTGLPFTIQPFPYGENPYDWESVFRKAITSLKLEGKRIGVEPGQMRLLEYNHVKAAVDHADFADASSLVSSLRIRKDESGAVCTGSGHPAY
jgi:Xaa-Pro dipeptidase